VSTAQEAQLSLPSSPSVLQLGYLVRNANDGEATADEIIALPIVATDTNEPLAALVVGFESSKSEPAPAATRNGIWTAGTLCMSGLPPPLRDALAAELQHPDTLQKKGGRAREVQLAGAPYLLLSTPLNRHALYPAAYEVTLYSLADAAERLRTIRWEIVAAGIFLLLGGYGLSAFFSARLSGPVEKLAVDSEENRAQWTRAEAALQLTSAELQRAARFSADASHQLKTPLAVLRAGLEELLTDGQLAPEMREEISTLIHQTYRLAQVVEDLLLLSRMDAGRLHLALEPIDLHALIDAWLDDLSAIPDGNLLEVQSDVSEPLFIRGEKRYTNLILQNLLENARKYNRPGGRVSVTAQLNGETVILRIVNTGQPIASSAREHIFERFHRGAVAENVPGHGLGLNLARELARLHGGDVWLASSDTDCTEFCVRFLLAVS
jgi:signal transduction histidine kinase